jgi:two-component system cell cycle sensor histidine kinase/response regulator CckA
MLAPPPPSVSRLLRVEHAVAEALLEAPSAEDAYPALLAAIGEGLEWRYGGLWLPVAGGVLHCVATWAVPELERFATLSRTLALHAGEGLPGRVQESGRPLWIADVTRAENFPRRREAAEAGLRDSEAR